METPDTAAPDAQPIDLGDPSLYVNRELSWLQFNQRVLEEALNQALPLLERVKFLAIFANNLDEFFMIRVSGLGKQIEGGVVETPPDGLTPSQQLAGIRESLAVQTPRAARLWAEDLEPALRGAGINICPYTMLQTRQLEYLRRYFAEEVFPVLTPLAFDPAHPFPHISNLSLNLAVVVRDPKLGESFARVKVADVFPRLIPVPDEDNVDRYRELGLDRVMATSYVWLEELIAAHLDLLFPGLEVLASYPFRITRDADLEIKSDEAADLLTNIEELVELRHWGSVVRLEIDDQTPERIRDVLMRNLNLAPYQVYQQAGPLGMAALMELTRIDRPDLKYAPLVPRLPSQLAKRESIFDVIRREDLLLYHPYDSFMPVVDFVREAATDPNVLAIKQTLYRVGANSPIVEALTEARDNGKQVAVLLELQARFDEENNIAWARALEDEGVHVVYGVLGLKTHAKVCMVVRREADGIRRYVHLGTGNYNHITARIYADLSYMTCDPVIGADVSDLFNALTGYSRKDAYRKLIVAPWDMREQIIARIDHEIARHRSHGDGYIAFKLNSLVDKQCIQALYRASQAGIPIDLQVRGICCLCPGISGVSETITATSIVGRFLEHARIFYFRNGGDEDVLLGSADLMPRNLDRRVEVLFPVKSPELRRQIVEELLKVHLRDTAKARRYGSGGVLEPVVTAPEMPLFNSQEAFVAHWRAGGVRMPE